jgi:aminoglycoside 3-N-acetyltransferase
MTIKEDLQSAGLSAGDLIMAHCSFKPLKTAGLSPDNVIDAILEIIGPEGTLMTPTFTYSYAGVWNAMPYNPDTSAGIENGIISETFRKRPGVLRSGHPTYSAAALGKHAEFLTANREFCSPLGKGSSYGDALNLGAKILLIGVGNNRNSMIHHIEAVSGLPYNDIPFRHFWGDSALVEKDGAAKKIPLVPEYPACSDNFSWLDRELVMAGIASECMICGAPSYLTDARRIRDFILEKLRQKPDCLLCESFICEPCSLRRFRLREAGLI